MLSILEREEEVEKRLACGSLAVDMDLALIANVDESAFNPYMGTR